MEDESTSIVTRLLFGAALDLSAKAYAQPIGVEDSWDDLGDGVVEISAANTLRVVRYPEPSEEDGQTAAANDENKPPTASAGKKKKKSKKNKSSAADEDDDNILDVDALASRRQQQPPDILIEDHISEEIPLVGKDCCIVWNSPTHDMSFCIMFTSECGYAAVWSAVHLLQGKPEIPPLGWDYLQSFRSMEEQHREQQRELEDKKKNMKQQQQQKKSGAGNNKKKNNADEPERSLRASVDLDGGGAAAAAGGGAGGSNEEDDDPMNDPLTSSMRPAQQEESVDTVIVDCSSDSALDGNNGSKKKLSPSPPQEGNDDNDDDASPPVITSDEKIAEAFSEAVRNVSSMSFIHRHCVAQSYIEGKCALTTSWGMHSASVVQVLFSLFHPGLIFHCVDEDDVFEKLVSVISSDYAVQELGMSSSSLSIGSGNSDDKAKKQQQNNNNNNNKKKPPVSRTLLRRWSTPKLLPEAEHSVDVSRALNRSMRLSLLRHEMIIPGTEEGVLTFLETLQQQELHSVLAAVTDNDDFINDVISTISAPDSSSGKLEAALRCVGDVVQNAVTLLPREMMLPMIAKIDDGGLVEALEKLCGRILESNGGGSSGSSGSAPSSPVNGPSVALTGDGLLKVLDALAALLEASVVTMNTRAEEGIVGGLWRKPLMEGLTPTSANSNNSSKSAASQKGNKSSKGDAFISNLLKVLAFWNRLVLANGGGGACDQQQQQQPQTPRGQQAPSSSVRRTGSSSSMLSMSSTTSSSITGNNNNNCKESDYFQRQRFTSGLQRGGTFFLYHLCGLHDDEGHTVDRSGEITVVEAREQFRLHVATNILPMLVQPPPAAASTTVSGGSALPTSKVASMFSGSSVRNSGNGNNGAGGGATVALSRSPVVTSSELAFFECFMQWCDVLTLRKTLQVLLNPPSILPSLLAAIPGNDRPAAATAGASSLFLKSDGAGLGEMPASEQERQQQPQQQAISISKLPAHVLCARARMIRTILGGMVQLENEVDELVEKDPSLAPKGSSSNSSKHQRKSSMSGAENSSYTLPSMNPDPQQQQQEQQDLQPVVNSIISPLLYRMTFENDVLGPVLIAFTAIRRRTVSSVITGTNCTPAAAAAKTQDDEDDQDTPAPAPPVLLRRSPMLVAALHQLFQLVRAPTCLLPFRRFLRIRHSSALPGDLHAHIANEEEQLLRDELLPLDSSSLSLMSMSTAHPSSKAAAPHSGLSSVSSAVASGFSAGRHGQSPARTSPCPDASPGRRSLLIDAEVPPPRSPEQLPLKRRSPSPPNEAAASAPPPVSRQLVGVSSADPAPAQQQQQQQHDAGSATSSSGNNNSNINNPLWSGGISNPNTANGKAAAAASTSSVIAADLGGNNNGGGLHFRPVAPRKPSSNPPGQQAGGGGAAAGGGGGGGLAPRANSSGRPGSRGSSSGGRPRSGGGPGSLRSRSPVANLVGAPRL